MFQHGRLRFANPLDLRGMLICHETERLLDMHPEIHAIPPAGGLAFSVDATVGQFLGTLFLKPGVTENHAAKRIFINARRLNFYGQC